MKETQKHTNPGRSGGVREVSLACKGESVKLISEKAYETRIFGLSVK